MGQPILQHRVHPIMLERDITIGVPLLMWFFSLSEIAAQTSNINNPIKKKKKKPPPHISITIKLLLLEKSIVSQ